MFEDFLSWKKQNEDFLDQFKKTDSYLYARIYDVLRVLDYITNLEAKDIDDDMSIIFETGYAYLFSFVNDVKLYLENYFDNNFSKMQKYEDLINFDLYVCELKDSLIDDNNYNEIISAEFEYILTDIEEILSNKLDWNQGKIDEYNERLLSVMPMDKTYKCIDEVFVDVYEALKMD